MLRAYIKIDGCAPIKYSGVYAFARGLPKQPSSIYTSAFARMVNFFLKEFYDCTHAQFVVRENNISL